MSTVLKNKLSISDDRKFLVVTDITGIYSSGDNPTGWEGPNTEPSTITEAVIFITVGSNPAVQYNVFVDGSEYLPGELPAGYVINIPTQYTGANSDGYVPDGLISVDVRLGPISLRTKAMIFNDASVCCCVKKLQDVDYESCGCGGGMDEIPKSMVANQLLRSMRAAAASGKVNRATVYLTELQRICNESNCNC